MTFYRQTKAIDFKAKTLIVPVVSTANVSQLTADLLIATFDLDRVGLFSPKALFPVVGAREDGADGVTTALELYGRDDLNVCVIQQRAPAMKALKQEYVDDLLDFISQSSFASVILLGGMDSTDRSDAQMFTPIYQVSISKSTAAASGHLSILATLPIPPLPSGTNNSAAQPADGLPIIRGGGLMRRLLSDMNSRDWLIPTVALVQYVLEGDNRGDAHLMASVLTKVLGLESKKTESGWKEPSSWKQGLFGTGFDSTLYG